MTVRNEASTIERCIASARQWVDQILIADTGSTDNTIEIIQNRCQLPVVQIPLRQDRCLTLCDARNALIRQAACEWILTLDADETLLVRSPEGLSDLLASQVHAGYFGAWINKPLSCDAFIDYKLFLFRKSVCMSGLVHSSATPDLRRQGLVAVWQDRFQVLHQDQCRVHAPKHALRVQRLICAISKQPDWSRYYWFLGYTYYRQGMDHLAEVFLLRGMSDASGRFPVEQVCAGLILLFMAYRRGHLPRARSILAELDVILDANQADFELAINHRVLGWIAHARQQLQCRCPCLNPPPVFAY